MSGSNFLTITAYYDLSKPTADGSSHEQHERSSEPPPVEINRHGPRPTCVVVNTDLAVPKQGEFSPQVAEQDLKKRLMTLTTAVLATALPDLRK